MYMYLHANNSLNVIQTSVSELQTYELRSSELWLAVRTVVTGVAESTVTKLEQVCGHLKLKTPYHSVNT